MKTHDINGKTPEEIKKGLEKQSLHGWKRKCVCGYCNRPVKHYYMSYHS